MTKLSAGYPGPCKTSMPADKASPIVIVTPFNPGLTKETKCRYISAVKPFCIAYNQIGSGEQGYVPQAIAASIQALNAVASDERVPADLREQPPMPPANLLISDHEDA